MTKVVQMRPERDSDCLLGWRECYFVYDKHGKNRRLVYKVDYPPERDIIEVIHQIDEVFE